MNNWTWGYLAACGVRLLAEQCGSGNIHVSVPAVADKTAVHDSGSEYSHRDFAPPTARRPDRGLHWV